MADKKPKRPTYTTSVGIAKYPKLNEPDTKFKAEGEYKVDLRVLADDAAPLIEQLETLRDKFWDEQDAKVRKTYKKADVYTVETDDEGNETGYVIFKTKLDRIGKSKDKTWENEPKLFDAEGNDFPRDKEIWSGSKLIVAGTVSLYAMPSTKMVGVSLRCNGVQVIELKSGGERDASSFGFKKQEGYRAPSAQSAAREAAGEDDSDGDDAPAGDGEEF